MLGPMLSLALLAAQTPAPPQLSRDAALQLFSAAGFTFGGGRLTNRCGTAANPQVQFVDLNADGNLEAQVVDVNPACYAKPGAYFAVLTRSGDGPWRLVASDDAIASFPGTRTGGWQDIEVKPGNGSCPGLRHFDHGRYQAACARTAAAVPPPPPTPVNAVDATPPDQLPVDKAADKASVAALTAADRTAIFRAAGAKPIAPDKWRMCADDGGRFGYAEIIAARDVNGDGRPEAIVSEGGTACYGGVGQAYSLVTKRADGRWTKMFDDTGILIFKKTRGADGYPDIINGGPGMCFGVLRWNGHEYALIGGNDGDGHSCRFP
jgi:hypothetical protein